MDFGRRKAARYHVEDPLLTPEAYGTTVKTSDAVSAALRVVGAYPQIQEFDELGLYMTKDANPGQVIGEFGGRVVSKSFNLALDIENIPIGDDYVLIGKEDPRKWQGQYAKDHRNVLEDGGRVNAKFSRKIITKISGNLVIHRVRVVLRALKVIPAGTEVIVSYDYIDSVRSATTTILPILPFML